jgi:HD-GYP domain-containing protein (c-di-GMP phosphodiesterase class II)
MQIVNYYTISLSLGSMAALLSGLFVYFKNKSSLINKTFLLTALSSALWSAGYLGMILSTNLSMAWRYNWVLHFAAILIPPFYLNFVLALLGEVSERKRMLYYAYTSSIFFLIISPSRLFVNNVEPKFIFNYCCNAGPLYILFTLYFLIWITYGLFRLISAYKTSAGIKNLQFKYATITSIVGFAGGASVFFLTFNIPFPPYLLILFMVYPIFTGYSIFASRVMDIEIVIRETAIFAGIFGFSIGLFMLAIVAGEQLLQPHIGLNRWVIPAVSLLIVTFAIRPIERLVYTVVGKYLFRKKFEYQKTLQDAAEGMSRIRDPKKLLQLIVHIVSAKLKLTAIAVLLYDSKQQRYRLKASRGTVKDKFINLSAENPLIVWLSEQKKPITLEEIRKWTGNRLGRDSLGVLKSDLLQIQERMEDLQAAVCVPCFFRDELLGVLVLGEKKTGDFFSQDDLDLFSALSNEAAIALKNSQLYFEIDKKANELEALYKREHRLFMHASVAFAAAIDARDSYTHGHSERVTNISLAILDYIGPVDEVDRNPLFRQRLQVAAVLHDVGKIGVPDDILHKPSKLDAKEEKLMQKHPSIGADIVSHIKGLRDLIGGIKYHHERYDGKGYPEGLKSDQIPFMARIISVADTYDAMTSDRPYRKGLDHMIAREEIQKNAAAQFDPFIVAAFLRAFEEGKVK